MKVNRSGYYAYASGRTFRASSLKINCTTRVKECFEFHRRRYGSRRIAAQLNIGRATVQKILRREGLRAIQPKSYKPQTTDSRHGLPICANLLRYEANAPTGKGEVFVGDITYLRLRISVFLTVREMNINPAIKRETFLFIPNRFAAITGALEFVKALCLAELA